MNTQTLRPHYFLRARNFSLALGARTFIMGIVNVTPDSFSADGKINPAHAVNLARTQIRDGADLIDVGGESSRPGATRISAKEEIKRIIPVITKLAKTISIPISVDTYKGLTALHALDAGASIINNIQGIASNKTLLKMAGRYKAGVVLMHMRGTPKNMQKKTAYKNLISEIITDLKNAVENCLEFGIKSDNIIVDAGIGFAKTPEQNLEIIDRLRELNVLKKPILIGTSRKSFIGKILNCEPQKRLNGTIASSVLAVANGAHILRVHDVKAIKQAVLVTDAIIGQTKTS